MRRMNPHSRHLQAGQTRFGGYRLLRPVESQASGIDSWLAEQHGGLFLLQVLPLTRSLTEAEKAPLHKLRHLGQRAGRAASRMTLRDVCEEEGRESATALVEAFPPLPEGSAEWLDLPSWTARQGAATTGLVAGHLPRLGLLLGELPGGRHGSITPEKIWLATQGGEVHAVVLSSGALADFRTRVPELSSAPLKPDVQGLGQVLYTWLTGLTPAEKSHTALLKDLNAAHKGAARTPEHWQRLIVSSMDEDPSFHPPGVGALIDSLLHPVGPAAAAAPSPVKPPKDSFWLKASAVITAGALGLTFVSWMQSHKAQPEVVKPTPAPQAPTFDPPAPVPEKLRNSPFVIRNSPPPLPQPEVPKPVEPTPKAQPKALPKPEIAQTAPPKAPQLPQTYHPPRLLPQPVPTPAPAPVVLPPPPPPIKPAPPMVAEVKPDVAIKALPVSRAVAVPEESVVQEHERIVRAFPFEPGEAFSAQPQTYEAFSMPPPPVFNLDQPPSQLMPNAPIPSVQPAPPPIYIPPTPWEWALPIFDWRPWKALQPAPSQRQPSRARVRGQPDLPLWWQELPR